MHGVIDVDNLVGLAGGKRGEHIEGVALEDDDVSPRVPLGKSSVVPGWDMNQADIGAHRFINTGEA